MLETSDLTPAIGSEVVIDAAELLDGSHADEIRELLVERGVLVMRGMDLDDDQLRAFTATLGEVRQGTVYEQANAGMLKVEHIPGSYFWHLDGAYIDLPPFATVLAARVVAPVGGETEFASSYAAFEALPAEEQERLSRLQVVHTMKAAHNDAIPEPTLEQFENWMRYRRTHPLVWQHASGRRSLVIGATASHIVDMHFVDSQELLSGLVAHSTQDQFVYRHSWKLGDIVLWDNTGTMHRVRPFDLSSGRMLHRFTVEGVESISGVTELANA